MRGAHHRSGHAAGGDSRLLTILSDRGKGYFESKLVPTKQFSGATEGVNPDQTRRHESRMIQAGIKEAEAAVVGTGAAGTP
jgi:hypothetical protein